MRPTKNPRSTASGAKRGAARPARRSRLRDRVPRLSAWLGLILAGFVLQVLPALAQTLPLPIFGGEEAEEPARDEPSDATAASDDDDGDSDAAASPEVAATMLAWNTVAAARHMAGRESVGRMVGAGASGVYIVQIHGEIELGIAYYIGRGIEDAVEANAAAVLFDIETPGGRVDAAIEIRDAILDAPIPTIAYIDRRAWSAGALIAMAADLIFVAEGSSIGAATPITMGGGGEAQPVEEKVVSALRGEFRSVAETTSRSAAVAEAMVDNSLAVPGVVRSGQLLTLTGHEALAIGLVEGAAPTRAHLLEDLGLTGHAEVVVEQSWSETLVRVITSPAIAGLLMSLGMLGLLFELMSPGFGWAGGLGLFCLALFFAGHFLVHLAGFEELALFLAGVLLLGAEIFFIPGFGVAGVLGILAIGAALVLSLVNLDVDIVLSPVGIHEALLRVAISLAGTAIAVALLFKFVPRTAFGQRLVLKEALASGTSITEPDGGERLSVGQTGKALTDLRPYGKARFGEQRVEVVSDGDMVPQGTTVRIVRIAGSRIEVRGLPAGTPGEEQK